jgi:hypothetical protein
MSTEKIPTSFSEKSSGLEVLALGLEEKSKTVFGENGCPEIDFSNTSNIERLLVALKGFSNHSQNRSYEVSMSIQLSRLSEARKETPEYSHNIFKLICLLMAHTRDCRKEGKGVGSRSPTWILFIWAWNEFPECREELKNVFRNIYELYGSINDLNLLYVKVVGKEGFVSLTKFIVEEWVRNLTEVREVVNKYNETSSGAGSDPVKLSNLAAKWAPRENKRLGNLARHLARQLFPNSNNKISFRCYRKMLSTANKMLDTAEVHMCHDGSDPYCPKSGDWNIFLEKTPGRCLHVHKKAFQKRIPIRWEAFMESLKKPESKGAKGTSVFITELARALVKQKDELAEAQWQDQVRNLQEAAASNGLDLGEFLGNFVCLLDFSASMTGDPMDLAMALGAFISPLQKGAFKGKCLSFETSPHWVDISGATTIHDAMKIYESSPWGGSTNFEAVHRMILDVVSDHIKSGGTADILPKFFLVVSDMQFNNTELRSITSWETMY